MLSTWHTQKLNVSIPQLFFLVIWRSLFYTGMNRFRPRVHPFITLRSETSWDQKLRAWVQSQHLFMSSKIIRPDITWGARCVNHCKVMWAAGCCLVPHSQFENGARSQLRIDEQKHSTQKLSSLKIYPEFFSGRDQRCYFLKFSLKIVFYIC